MTGESDEKGRPVGKILSRTGEGEGEDRTSRRSEGVRLTEVCSAAIASGGEFEIFDSRWVDVESPGVEVRQS